MHNAITNALGEIEKFTELAQQTRMPRQRWRARVSVPISAQNAPDVERVGIR